jgi:hypothetical protein
MSVRMRMFPMRRQEQRWIVTEDRGVRTVRNVLKIMIVARRKRTEREQRRIVSTVRPTSFPCRSKKTT